MEADKKDVAKNKKNFEVCKDFELAGTEYKKGDTWRKPEDWQVDNEYTALWSVQHKNKGGPAVAFVYPVETGMMEQTGPGGRKQMVPVEDSRRVVLPVA